MRLDHLHFKWHKGLTARFAHCSKNRVVFEDFPEGTAGSVYTATLAVPATATGAHTITTEA
jgi:hypothetical protein